MNRKVIYAAIILVFTMMIVIYYQNTSASKINQPEGVLQNSHSPTYWLDNPKDALIFEAWYPILPLTNRRSGNPDNLLDALFFQDGYVAREDMPMKYSYPDYPLDGKFFVQYFR